MTDEHLLKYNPRYGYRIPKTELQITTGALHLKRRMVVGALTGFFTYAD